MLKLQKDEGAAIDGVMPDDANLLRKQSVAVGLVPLAGPAPSSQKDDEVSKVDESEDA